MSDQAVPARTGRAKTVVLVLSLGMNLLVAGVAFGVWVHGPPGPRDGRDLGFGVFDEAFRPQDRAALRDAVRERSGDLRAARRELSRDVAAVLEALRAEPFDARDLAFALEGQHETLRARLRIGAEVIGDYLSDLPKAERLGFADRLEAQLTRGKSRGHSKD